MTMARKGLAFFHQLVPSVEVGQFGVMDIQRIPPMNRRRSWNVPHGKGGTGEKGTVRKTSVKDLRGSERQVFGSRYHRRIAFCRRRPDQFNEQWAQGRPKDG